MKKTSPEKDNIDHYTDWQNNQNNPGHFTGGRTPIWLSRPGRPKLLGACFLLFGLFYAAWIIYEIIKLLQLDAGTGEIVSIIFLTIPSIILVVAGITLIRKSRR